MPKTVQIRDIDDDTYSTLAKRAAGEGVSVPEYLRREIDRIVSRPSMQEWLARRPRLSTDISAEETRRVLDELRGPWPDDGST